MPNMRWSNRDFRPKATMDEYVPEGTRVSDLSQLVGVEEVLYLTNPITLQYTRCEIRVAAFEPMRVELTTLEKLAGRPEGRKIHLSLDDRDLIFESIPTFVIPKKLKKKENTMNFRNVAALMNSERVTTLSVIFAEDAKFSDSHKKYTYKVTRKLAEQLTANDKVLVATSNNTISKVAVVVEVHDSAEIDVDSGLEYAWVVDKIDMTGFEEALAEEEMLAEALRKERRNIVAKQAIAQLGFENVDIKRLQK